MLLEQYPPCGRVLLEQEGDPARHVEPGPLVVEPDRLVAERLGRELPAARRRGQRDHRVGMRVVDVRRLDEGVEQRLDRGPRLVGPDRGAEEVGDHRRVVHCVAPAERQELVEPQAGEPGRGDGGEVGAGAFHPEDAHLAPGVVGDRLLGRGVASALVRERSVGAEQVRAVDEPVDHADVCGTVVPPVPGGRDAV